MPEMSRRTATVPQHRYRYFLATLLLVLSLLTLYFWTAPMRLERFLTSATLDELNAAAQRTPDNPQVLYYQGMRLQEAGNMPLAYNAFAHAAELRPDEERIWLAWAVAAKDTKDVVEAISILETFRQNHPRNGSVCVALAQMYQQAQMPARAYDTALAATRIEPRNAVAWHLAGTEALALHQYAEAETAMRQAVALAPSDWNNYQGLSDALIEQRHVEEAIQPLRKAVSLAPQQVLPHLSLASTLLRTAKIKTEIEEAREHLRVVLTLVPELPQALLLMGKTWTWEERWAEARPLLEKAERLTPNDATVHFELARVYKNLNKQEASRAQLGLHEQALAYVAEKQQLIEHLRKRPDSATYLELARLLEAHGETAQAKDLYQIVATHEAPTTKK